jgi:transposase
LLVAFKQLYRRIEDWEREVAELKSRLNQNSTNSSRPPSSDPPSVKRAPPQPPSGKKRGGQLGHKPHRRALVPPEKVNESFDIRPEVCRSCGQPLFGDDPEPWQHQVAELPPIEPFVTEYRLHRLVCPRCGTRTCGRLPAGVPRGAFGPRLQAVFSLLASAYRLAKEPIQALAFDLFGLSVSTGMICKLERNTSACLEAPVEELRQYVRSQDAGADETSWRENRTKAWLWVVVTRPSRFFALPLPAGRKSSARCSVRTTAAC